MNNDLDVYILRHIVPVIFIALVTFLALKASSTYLNREFPGRKGYCSG